MSHEFLHVIIAIIRVHDQRFRNIDVMFLQCGEVPVEAVAAIVKVPRTGNKSYSFASLCKQVFGSLKAYLIVIGIYLRRLQFFYYAIEEHDGYFFVDGILKV